MDSNLAQFNGQNYLNLETFRRTGAGVKTPVWFVREEERFYIVTVEGTGKVKRIHNSGRVRIVPCKSDGRVTGDWLDARAGIVQDAQEENRLNLLFQNKYGFLKTLYGLYNIILNKKRTFIQIEAGQA